MKKFISCLFLTVLLIGVTSTKVNAQTTENISNYNLALKHYITYDYPYWGIEYKTGPEKTVYYAIHYDGNGNVLYGEAIRDADDFVMMKVYPDGSYEEYEAPKLTSAQIKAFNDKYNPKKVAEKIEKEKAELLKLSKQKLNDVIKAGNVEVTHKKNYWVYLYHEGNDQTLATLTSFLPELYYGNTHVNPYPSDFDVKGFRDKILKRIKKIDRPVPIKVIITPFQCDEYNEGLLHFCDFIEKDNKKAGYAIVLFNNSSVSLEKQFEIQLKNYIEEVKNM